jgi:hypothetical protein
MKTFINNMEEDIEVGVEYHTEEISLVANINREDGASNEYSVDIDENTKNIVITPKDAKCFFTLEDSIDTVNINLTVNMLSESDNFEYNIDVDAIGQLVISPKSEDTDFISLVEDDNLNLITDVDEPYDDSVCEEEIEYLTNNYAMSDGEISTTYDREKDCAVKLLSDRYGYVNAYQRDGSWIIEYSAAKKDSSLTEETDIIGDEDGEPWAIQYEFTKNESLMESDEDSSSNTQQATVLANNADDALKYAKQYALSQRWHGAEVVSIRRKESDI